MLFCYLFIWNPRRLLLMYNRNVDNHNLALFRSAFFSVASRALVYSVLFCLVFANRCCQLCKMTFYGLRVAASETPQLIMEPPFITHICIQYPSGIRQEVLMFLIHMLGRIGQPLLPHVSVHQPVQVSSIASHTSV